jgi:hypothetical protein
VVDRTNSTSATALDLLGIGIDLRIIPMLSLAHKSRQGEDQHQAMPRPDNYRRYLATC